MEKETVTYLGDLKSQKTVKKETVYDKIYEQIFENLIIDFELDIDTIKKTALNFPIDKENPVLKFKNCEFKHTVSFKLFHQYEVEFSENCSFTSIKSSGLHNNITFKNCTLKEIDFEDAVFGSEENKNDKKGKVRFHDCKIYEANFRNTTFNSLADFWNSTFYKPVTFYKTDFNATAVFSAVTFKENVLFSYSLFDGKAIFGRTTFEKGIDISQAIIAGELQIFDLKFEYPKYKAEYVGTDNEMFHDYIDTQHKIPQINKVTTFQILKSQYAKQANHIDEVTMRKEEQKAFSQLIQSRKKDSSLKDLFYGDRFILWLNRKSNHYKSDFRNGISFTVIVAVFFLFLTLITTGEFWTRLCFDCKFDSNVIGFVIKSFVNFLNPVHKTTYIDGLNPILGIPYVFDFLGRIAVGFGIYQTIQAFRKYK